MRGRDALISKNHSESLRNPGQDIDGGGTWAGAERSQDGGEEALMEVLLHDRGVFISVC